MPDTRRLISSGSTFERDIGYSRAVVQGDWVFVSGTTGFDYASMTIADDIARQTDQCLRNIQAALTQADASLADVVRVTYIVPSASEFRDCWPVLRRYFGEILPAATMLSAGLADARMKIEIEVTALKHRHIDPFRQQLADALAWKDAHVGFDGVMHGFPADKRGVRPSGFPYSAWQLLEHLRIAQHDILDFCVNSDYEEMNWPADYWPTAHEPPSDEAWHSSIRRYQEDRDRFAALAINPAIDLAGRIPHGSGQTYGRELLLVLDHGAYHVGQLLLLRRLLGIWPA